MRQRLKEARRAAGMTLQQRASRSVSKKRRMESVYRNFIKMELNGTKDLCYSVRKKKRKKEWNEAAGDESAVFFEKSKYNTCKILTIRVIRAIIYT